MSIYAEPVWVAPTEYLTESIFARRPVLSSDMTAILVRVLQFHFSTPSYIERNFLKKYLWNPDIDLSKILIGPESMKNAKAVGKMPAILVGPITAQVDQIGLEGFSVSETVGSTTTVVSSANNFSRLNINMHGVYCRGLSGTETDALRDEVLIFLTAYSMIMRQDLNLFNLNIKGVDQSKKIMSEIAQAAAGKETDWYMYPIQVLWSVDLSYTITEDIPI